MTQPLIEPTCPACGAKQPRVLFADRGDMRLRCVRCQANWTIKTPQFTKPTRTAKSPK